MAPRRKAYREGADRALAEELAALPGLTLEELKERWREVHGSSPPSRLGRALMVRAIAYRMQELAFGGLRPAIRRRLAQAAE